LSPVAPASQQKGRDAGTFRGELQPAARYRGERSDFADHCGNAGSAQAFLHRPQDLAITRRPDQHEVRGVEPMGGEAGPIEIRMGKTPQHHTVPSRAPLGCKPSEDAGDKGSGQRAILLITARAEDLVQGPSCEPAARQHSIDRGNAERRYPVDRRCRPLDPPNALAQLRKAGSPLGHVPFLFSF
jgi:hypothetical protein